MHDRLLAVCCAVLMEMEEKLREDLMEQISSPLSQ
jgi:hypothetical protein